MKCLIYRILAVKIFNIEYLVYNSFENFHFVHYVVVQTLHFVDLSQLNATKLFILIHSCLSKSGFSDKYFSRNVKTFLNLWKTPEKVYWRRYPVIPWTCTQSPPCSEFPLFPPDPKVTLRPSIEVGIISLSWNIVFVTVRRVSHLCLTSDALLVFKQILHCSCRHIIYR